MISKNKSGRVSFMKLDTATLPNDPEELKSLLLDQEERYRSRVEYLEEKVRLLTQALFGKKSEKRPVLP